MTIPDGRFLVELEGCLSSCSRSSALDRITITGVCDLVQISEMLLVKDEDTTSAVIQAETIDWRFVLTLDGRKRFTWDDEGSIAEMFEGGESDRISAAVARGDLDQLLAGLIAVLGSIDVQVDATWRTPTEKLNAHYIETIELFADRAFGDEWHKFARELDKPPKALVIGDFAGSITTKGFQIVGTGVIPAILSEGAELDPWKTSDGRPRLPSPTLFAPSVPPIQSSRDIQVLSVLNGLTRALTWYWVSNSVKVGQSGIDLYFSGSRVVEIQNHRPRSADSVEHDVRLAEWIFSSEDPARLEAVRKAASLALADNDSLSEAAAVVFRTAESLYEITRRDVIAEALATRRSVRQAAVTAGNDAAKSAREATGKATERAMVQIAASLGIVIANGKELINFPVTMIILTSIGVVVVATWTVSRSMDLRVANDALDSFVFDLDEYRDTLSEADIDQLRNLRSVTSAREHLGRAKVVARVLSLGVLLAIIVAVLVLILVEIRKSPVTPVGPQQAPSTSNFAPSTVQTTTIAPRPRSPSRAEK